MWSFLHRAALIRVDKSFLWCKSNKGWIPARLCEIRELPGECLHHGSELDAQGGWDFTFQSWHCHDSWFQKILFTHVLSLALCPAHTGHNLWATTSSIQMNAPNNPKNKTTKSHCFLSSFIQWVTFKWSKWCLLFRPHFKKCFFVTRVQPWRRRACYEDKNTQHSWTFLN